MRFNKNRFVAFCRDLNRVGDDPDQRTFVQDSTIRAGDARTLLEINIELTDAGPARREAGSPNDPGRLPTMAEKLAFDISDKCDV